MGWQTLTCRFFQVVVMTVSVAQLQNVPQGEDDQWPALNYAELDRMLGKFNYSSIIRLVLSILLFLY